MAQVQAYRSSYGGNLTDDILQQMQVPQQVLQQMIQEKAEIDRGRARRHHRERRRSAGADHRHPRAAGERTVHRRAALSPAAGAADAADDAGRFRAVGAREPDARQVPRRAHRVDDGVGHRARARIQAPQRKSHARRRRGARRQLQDAGQLRPTRRFPGTTTRTRNATAFPIAGRSSSCGSIRPSWRRRSRCRRKTSSGATTSSSANTRRPSRFARATSC